jgi:PilZ domain-containing protein
MAIKNIFSGRMEKRILIAIVVRLTPAQDQPASEAELTYTDNVSAHGARVVSSRAWQIGEVLQITSLKDEITISGKVAYCMMVPDNRYSIGLNFKDRRVTWSAYRTYSGT